MGYFNENEQLNINKQNLYYDLPNYKYTNANGELRPLYNEDALANAIKIWITSARGENIRRIDGGYLYAQLGKPMNSNTAEAIKNSLLLGFENDFTPNLTITTLEVVPDYVNKIWKIYIAGFTPIFNVGVNTAVAVKNNI